MTPEQRSAAGKKGAAATTASGKRYRLTGEKAVEAGRKGGLATAANRRARQLDKSGQD